MERLLFAADALGHSSSFISTNGYDGMEHWTEAKSQEMMLQHKKEMAARPYDIDITYTIPTNFPARFLPNSKVKIGRYDYESSIIPKGIAKYLNVPDYIVGSSDFVLDIFARAGAKLDKLKKIPSGVDPKVFNENGPRLNLKKMGFENNPFVFLCVSEPHYRKQLDKLIDIYCSRFTSSDDVLLLIKTKFPGPDAKPFEMDIRPHLAAARQKYGTKMPAIKVLGGFLSEVAPLYRTAHAFVLPTAGEGWGMPFLESMACGNVVIAPEYGGQLDFLNKNNSILCPVDICPALPQEQYGGMVALEVDPVSMQNSPNGTVGRPKISEYGDAMRYVYENYSAVKQLLSGDMRKTSEKFSWEYAAKKMLELA